jgi:two-component system, NarL family, nitrate/nitrite response regulator NarL
MSDKPRVLVADDHAPTRRIVCEALSADGFDICADVENARDAVEAALEIAPDICILDISMPGGGINAARVITDRLPGTTIVMFTISEEHADLTNALRAGARGYLLKTMDPAGLGRALRAVLAGEGAIPRQLAAKLIDDYRVGSPHGVTDASGRPVKLSSREWEMLNLLREGLSTSEIAQRSYVAAGTVRSHLASLQRKLGVRSREEAVRLAFGESGSSR